MTVPIFAATLFVGSFLMFAVEPMAARQMLPVLGGTPMVWNGCVVFFQAALLLGYGGAHLLTHWVAPRLRLLVYGGLALLSLPLLNLRVDVASGVGAETAPLAWLLVSLITSVGPPFLVLAVCSSVVQSALASSSHKSAKDPYFLYVASNAGSLVALFAYPVVIEPWLGLTQQAGAWKIAYGVFVVLVLICAALALFVLNPRADNHAAVSDGDAAFDEPVRLGDRVRWCALAAVPSSLMLGVTTALTTDIAPIPLLWVVPLALYLLTFIVAFSRVGPQATALGSRLLPVLLLVLAFLLLLRLDLPVGPGLLIHLVPFVVAAMVCHGRLAETRPSPRRLTEFYFWLALGGMLGGLFNTLLAPALFSSLVEYPVALVLVAVLRPIKSDDGFRWLRDIWLPLVAAVVVATLSYLGWDRSHLAYVLCVIAALVTVTFAQRDRRWAFAGVVGVMLLGTGSVSLNAAPTLQRVRTFFGIYAVHVDNKQRHVLSHGTTMHGMQALDAARSNEPLTYYHRTGPFGQMMASIPRLREPGRFTGIGLGVGSLATYRQPGQKWTFFEIDAAMEEIARDERLFTFLPQCGPACEVVLGDARLSLARQDAHYELIALDAFTSDAIPLHLLTNEAMQVYLAKLAPHGVLAFHISNRHLKLAPIVARLAAANGLVALHRVDLAGGAARWPDGKSSSQWVVMARSAADLGSLTTSSQWVAPAVQPSTPLWTDDFTNLLTVMDFGSN